MLSEKELRSFLICAFENLRAQNSALHSLTTELAAVRDVLCEHGPKYEELLGRKRAHYVEGAKPLVADDFAKFDAIIERLKADQP